MTDWQARAAALADRVTGPDSRWNGPVRAIPRHLLVPRWWGSDASGWLLQDGHGDEEAWLRAAYADRTLVTSIGGLHADHAGHEDRPSGRATSSSTMPSLVIWMLRHARIRVGMDVLDVATGSGYSAALLTSCLGAEHVTSIDVDPYLTEAATNRLDALDLHPSITTCDATGPIPGTYDRLISMVSVKPIPASWLAALRPGGRLVTTITGTMMIITAAKTPGGGAVGRVEPEQGGFMTTRTGPTYPPGAEITLDAVRDADGEHVGRGRYPIIDVEGTGELYSMMELTVPGIVHHSERSGEIHTVWMLHPDGSWARATSDRWREPPLVHQAGPRRLWDILDDLRERWLARGFFWLHGAHVNIDPTGDIHLSNGPWRATIS